MTQPTDNILICEYTGECFCCREGNGLLPLYPDKILSAFWVVSIMSQAGLLQREAEQLLSVDCQVLRELGGLRDDAIADVTVALLVGEDSSAWCEVLKRLRVPRACASGDEAVPPRIF